MMNYQIELKQLVRFPYCRLYRSFINSIIENTDIRKRGGSLLFFFVVLFSLANYRCSRRNLEGLRFSVAPSEWVARYSELCEKMGIRYQYQMLEVLHRLEEIRLIEYKIYPQQKIVRFKICCWKETNTSLDYSAPCCKNLGFIFFPVDLADKLITAGRCSETDMLLDLWLHAVYNDPDVAASELLPVAYYRNGSKTPMVNYGELARRWGCSKTAVYRFLKKFEKLEMLGTVCLPGSLGSVIYLKNYLSVMFCISDAALCRQELCLALHVSTPEPVETNPEQPLTGQLDSVADDCSGVPNPNIRKILENVRKALFASGFRCSACAHAIYRLSCLSDCGGEILYDLHISCGDSGQGYDFTIKLREDTTPVPIIPGVEVEVI